MESMDESRGIPQIKFSSKKKGKPYNCLDAKKKLLKMHETHYQNMENLLMH